MYRFLLFCLLCVFCFKAGAVPPKKDAPAIPKVYHIQVDSSKISLQKFNADSLNKYRNDPDFTYQEKANVKAGLSWWTRFWRWFWEMILRLFPKSSPGVPFSFIRFMEYLIAFVLLGLIIFIIFKIAGLNLDNIFNRQPKDIDIPFTESLENIHQITFDEEIEKALSQRNYRLAVRLLYLRTLKQLSDAQLISWQMEKTNSAYHNELTDAGQRQSFGILTRQFEYVWYGDFPVDGRSFQNINTLFQDFKTTVK